MRNKIIIIITSIAVLLLALLILSEERHGEIPLDVGLSGFHAPLYNWKSAPHKPLVIWTREHDLDRVYMRRAFLRYEEQTGNKINVVTFPQSEFDAEVMRALNGGDDKPDILVSYGGTNIEYFDPDKNFYDFSNASWIKDLTFTSINQTIYNGKIIGLPHWESSISGTIYNKSIFKKLGIKIPETQDEFLSVCETLRRNGIIPVYLPYKVTSMMLYQFPMDSITGTPEILEGLNNGTLSYSDIPEISTIVKWYRTMAALGYFGDNYTENGWDGMNEAMSSGRYGMMLCWDTWLYTDFNGDPAEFGIMPAFMGVPPEGTFEGPNQALLIVNKNGPNLNAALNLIAFLADPYNYNVAFSGIYTAPVFKNQYTSISTPQYVEAEQIIERKFRNSTTWLRVKGFSQLDASCIQKYMTNNNYTVEECLRDMDTLRHSRKNVKEKSGSE